METTQISELIQRWQLVSINLNAKQTELKNADASLHEYQTEYLKSKQEWNLEKERISKTIDRVLADVVRKKAEFKAIECETTELRAKVEEKRRRNEEYLKVLSKRKEVVDQELEQAERCDSDIKNKLSEFQNNRMALKEQLLAAIRKVEESLPQEREAHRQKVSLLKFKISQVECAIESEARSWELEQALRSWNEASRVHEWLLEEAIATENGKDTWAKLIQEANALNPNQILANICELRTLLTI